MTDVLSLMQPQRAAAPQSWRVFRNGRYIGITESNYPWALRYWGERARVTGDNYQLRKYPEETMPCDTN